MAKAKKAAWRRKAMAAKMANGGGVARKWLSASVKNQLVAARKIICENEKLVWRIESQPIIESEMKMAKAAMKKRKRQWRKKRK
jgi:hypothetical protein